MVLAQKKTGRPMDQNRISRHNPCIYRQLIFDKLAQNTRWRKESLLPKCCWENWISTCKRLKLDPCLSSCTKLTWKFIKYFNIRSEILKQLNEGVGNILEQVFLNRTQKVQHLREAMNKWEYIKQKSSCTAKETVTRLKIQPTE
jgi:hypothetical protein